MKWFVFFIVFVSSNSFSIVESSIPGVRAHHSLVYDEEAKAIILTGGSTPLDGGNSFKFYNDVWRFNGNHWVLIGQAGDERSGISLAYDTKRKRIHSFGGFTSDNRSRSEFRILENNEWKDLPAPGFTAAESGLAYDENRDKFIVFGGSGEELNGETWEWDGKEWKRFEGSGPEPRQAFAMVYDVKRKKTIIFGGLGKNRPASIFNDTWEFDGMQWTKVADNGPSGRASCGFAYDSDKGQMIVFGGMTKDGFVNDTWSWDGEEWKKIADNGPMKRAMGYLAYDKERKKIVMFGGRLGWPNDTNDTWEWDGKQWNELHF